jgi:predicted heme/steroid binding protein
MGESLRTLANIREALRGELSAINEYERFAREAESDEIRCLFYHIAADEKHHVAEEYRALVERDPDQTRAHAETLSAREAGGTPAQRTFTRQELAQFNGQGGRPVYVAAEGAVYDVTNVPVWAMGKHFVHSAGQDLSVFLRSAHDISILNGLPKVGTLTP